MTHLATRRAYSPGALALTMPVVPALAQDKPVLKFSAVFSEQDIRAELTKKFAEDIKDDFTLQPYLAARSSSRAQNW